MAHKQVGANHHEIIAMKIFQRFLIEYGLFMDCLGDKPMKTHSFMANKCIPWIFMATGHS